MTADLNWYHKGCGGVVTIKIGRELFPYEHDDGTTELIQDQWLECLKCHETFMESSELVDAEGNPV
jgi:hypothetical protein